MTSRAAGFPVRFLARWERLRHLLIALGFDALPPMPPEKTATDIFQQLTSRDRTALAQMHAWTLRSFELEEKRLTTLDQKATQVASALGLMTTLTLGSSALLLNNLGGLSAVKIVVVPIVALYLWALALLALAMAHAMLAITVGGWFSARPDESEIMDLQNADETRLLREELAGLLVSVAANSAMNRRKAGEVAEAQILLMRATAVLMLSGCCVALLALLHAFGLL